MEIQILINPVLPPGVIIILSPQTFKKELID